MITLHALGTSTSRMALRFSRLDTEREPRVATSLCRRWYYNIEFSMIPIVPDGCDAMLWGSKDWKTCMSILLRRCQSIHTFMAVEHCECGSRDLLVARDSFSDWRLLFGLRGRYMGKRIDGKGKEGKSVKSWMKTTGTLSRQYEVLGLHISAPCSKIDLGTVTSTMILNILISSSSCRISNNSSHTYFLTWTTVIATKSKGMIIKNQRKSNSFETYKRNRLWKTRTA